MPPDPAAAVDAWFADQDDLTVERLADGGWFTVLAGERKRTVPVHLSLGQGGLAVESFFTCAPDENEAELFAYLLHRNTRTYTLRFARYDTGDVMLVGLVPLAAVTVDELDRTMGQLLTAADEAFDHALKTGFASYIEREQTWRASVGAPRNPIT